MYVRRNDTILVMKAFQLAEVDTMSLKVVLVFGTLVASLKDQPPTAIHVFSDGFFDFRAVNRRYRSSSPTVMGFIWKVVGWKKAKVKLRCVKAVRSMSSGCRLSHERVVALL